MPRPRAGHVFCNFPFDRQYERLYLALMTALIATGQTPRCVLEIPPQRDRLSRIMDLMTACPYSLHDLSRVERSRGPSRVPRFNMPFETGLAVHLAHVRPTHHQFRLLEARPHRLQQTLSDLNGYDPVIHHGTVDGMFHAICDVFTHARPFPIGDLRSFRYAYRKLRQYQLRTFGASSPYTPDRFAQLVPVARALVSRASLPVFRDDD